MVYKNPFCDRARPPQWAQLTRMAGDRAAILFEDLRSQVADIAGLIEELHYLGPELGWAPRYRVGDDPLFVACIMPGLLEANLALNRAARERVLVSRRVAILMKTAVKAAAESGGLARVRVELGSKRAVRAFARLVRFLSKNVAGQKFVSLSSASANKESPQRRL
jgi:hypothetical protein